MTGQLRTHQVRLEFGWGFGASAKIHDVTAASGWVDESAFLRNEASVQTVRGKTDENSDAAARLSFAVNSAAGLFMPDYQPSANWPNVVRGTPVRYSKRLGNPGSGAWVVRFAGWIDTIVPDWADSTANNPFVTFTAIDRIGVYSTESALGTSLDLVMRESNPTYYYVLDEPDDADGFLDSSGFHRPPLSIPPLWTPGQSSDNQPVGVTYAPTVDPASMAALHVDLGGHVAGVANSGFALAFACTSKSVSNVAAFTLVDTYGSTWTCNLSLQSGRDLQFTVTPPGAGLGNGYSYTPPGVSGINLFDGGWHIIALLAGVGTGTSNASPVTLHVDDAAVLQFAVQWSGSGAPPSWPPPTWRWASIGISLDAESFAPDASAFTGFAYVAAFGDVAATFADVGAGLDGFDGQDINDRLAVLTNSNITATPYTATVKALAKADMAGSSRVDQIQAAVAADAGYVVGAQDPDSNSGVDLIWLPGEGKVNPAVWMTVSIPAKKALTFPPIYDTQYLANAVTVSCPDGDAVAVDPVSTAANGPFDLSVTSGGTEADGQYLAEWLVNQHSAMVTRFGTLTIDLESNADLAAIWLSDDPLWNLLAVTGAPFHPDVLQFIEGYTETEAFGTWQVELNLSNAGNWTRCFTIADSNLGVIGLDGQTTGSTGALAGLGTGTFPVTTPTGGVLLSTAAGDYPRDWDVKGERITVTNVTGASSPQTATCSVRGVGGTKAVVHAAGETISLHNGAVISLLSADASTTPDLYSDTYADIY